MILSRFRVSPVSFIRSGLVLLTAALAAPLACAEAASTVTFKATYSITIVGINIGRAAVEGRFKGNSYAAAISGSTSGPARLVSDATAKLAGTGRIYGSRVLPNSFNYDTVENGFATHVTMAMRAGKITDLVAVPRLLQTPDRVPVTARHKINVVDPMAAFLVPLDRPGLPSGVHACNRTVKVFDGWTRYDIQLTYSGVHDVHRGALHYVGQVIVCKARYIPVAGHRQNRKSVQSLANNDRLEVWLAPLKDLPLLVPARIVIGTDVGDLIVSATRFSVDRTEQHAEADK